MNSTFTSIKNIYLGYKKDHPKKRVRDIATALNITEAEIIHSFSGSSVIPFKPNFKVLLEKMPDLGKVMVLTRNEACVHERKGIFEKVEVTNPHVGIVVDQILI